MFLVGFRIFPSPPFPMKTNTSFRLLTITVSLFCLAAQAAKP
jgi:hypothetical protein